MRLRTSLLLLGPLFAACVATTDESTEKAREALVQPLAHEVEPNGTSASATPLGALPTALEANVFDINDVDVYSFTAAAGDRVYAATMTSLSASGNFDSSLDLLGADGATVIENDNDNGTLAGLSSSIAGALAEDGTNYLRVQHPAAGTIRPYHLHTMVKSGSPDAEIEPNNSQATAMPLPASGWVSGALGDAADLDLYSIQLQAGDTVFASLDLDPERDGGWNGQLVFGPFGMTSLQVNDPGGAGPDSEALFVTVKDAGTYYLGVSSGGLGAPGTYHLAVSVQPQAPQDGCTTYTSADVPKDIPAAGGLGTSIITVPAGVRVGSLSVGVNLTHSQMFDVDVHLQSPAGNDNALFTDTGNQLFTKLDVVLSESAAFPISTFPVASGMILQPESAYRLHWFDGEDAGGDWTLNVEDDANNAAGGTLNGWSLTICPPPESPPCPPDAYPVDLLAADFEAGDDGFTHSGAADPWARGTPAGSVIANCNGGTQCFKTNLMGNYPDNAAGDLESSDLDLTGFVAPITLTWAQKYQMENASADHAALDVLPAQGSPSRVWEFLDATMSTPVGLANATLEESAGWGTSRVSLDAFAGQTIHLEYHFDSDAANNMGGWAIDDVKVAGCKVNTCGDGVVFGAEACDDGNLMDGDGCDSSCNIESSTGGAGGSSGGSGGSGGSIGGSGGSGASGGSTSTGGSGASTSTSTGGAGGSTSTGEGATSDTPAAQGGCGCATPGDAPSKPIWAPLAALAALSLLRRRKNTR